MSLLRRFTSHALLALAEAGLISLLVVGLIASTALAAPKGGRVQAGSATLIVNPDPAPADNFFHAEGCGYATGTLVNILVKNGVTTFFSVGVDGNGCISFDSFTGAPGTYRLEAYQTLKGRQSTLMGSTTFGVQ